MKTLAVKKMVSEIFPRLGLKANNAGVFAGEWLGSGPKIKKRSPIDGTVLARVTTATSAEVEHAIGAAQRAFQVWREVPAPRRGEVVRRLGLEPVSEK